MTAQIKHFAFFLFLLACLPARAEKIKRIVKETPVAKVKLHEMYNSSYTISANNKHIAYRLQKDEKYIAVVDSLQSKLYDEVSTPIFSADSKHFSYAGRRGKRWEIVFDNKEIIPIDSGVVVKYVSIDPNNILLFILRNAQGEYFMTPKKIYDNINENSITFFNNKMAFVATSKGKQFMVYDGNESLAYEMVGFPAFNPINGELAYWATDNDKYFLMHDHKKTGPFDRIGSVQYSKDGKHLLYDVHEGGKHYMVLDSFTKQTHEYLHSYLLNPDGTRLAYAVKEPPGNKYGYMEYMMIDGKRQGPYEQVMEGSLMFSPNGKEFVYAAGRPNDTIDESKATVEELYEWFIVRNGVEQRHYNMLQGSIMFSPDGSKFAYGGEKYTKRVVNLNGVEENPYDDIYYVVFSPDSKHLVYGAKNEGKAFVVVDENNGKSYDQFLSNKEIIFDSNNTFHYLAVKDDIIYLVEEKIE